MATEPPVIDCRGLKCPLPVLRMEKALAGLSDGETLVVLATDPMAKIDIPLHCKQNGHALTQSETDGILRFEIRKRGFTTSA